MNPENIPVIISTFEIVERPEDIARDIAAARDPLSLMADAATGCDSGIGLLARLDRLSIVNPASWQYKDLPAQLSSMLNITPAHAALAPTGGESPLRLIHQAASAVAAGQSQVALVIGAEAQYSVTTAAKAGITLPWPERMKSTPDYMEVAQHLEPRALQMGLFFPSHVYPFYDAACARHWGQTPAEAIAESGRLWADMAATARANAYRWRNQDFTAERITTPTPQNRLIAWPYTKAQVANPNVNQAACVMITSLSTARAAGVADDDTIYIGGGYHASAPRNFMARSNFHSSPAQDAVLSAIKQDKEFDAVELYSCFPIVPKMARRTLNLPANMPSSVAGGLSFFGAPLNNYMTHATCAMVRTLRGGKTRGLLYGQGEFVTKHHALALSSTPAPFVSFEDGDCQEDATEGDVPRFDPDASGAAVLESFTISYSRDGNAEHGIIIARTAAGTRTLAKVAGADDAAIERLANMDRYPIGAAGMLAAGQDGVPMWAFE